MKKQVACSGPHSLDTLFQQLSRLSLENESLAVHIPGIVSVCSGRNLTSSERDSLYKRQVPELILEAIVDSNPANLSSQIFEVMNSVLPYQVDLQKKLFAPFLDKGLLLALELAYQQTKSPEIVALFFRIGTALPRHITLDHQDPTLATLSLTYMLYARPIELLKWGGDHPDLFRRMLAQTDPQTGRSLAYEVVKYFGVSFLLWGNRNRELMMHILVDLDTDPPRNLIRDLGHTFDLLLIHHPDQLCELLPVVHPNYNCSFASYLIQSQGERLLERYAGSEYSEYFERFMTLNAFRDGSKCAHLFAIFCRESLMNLATRYPEKWSAFLQIENEITLETVAERFLRGHLNFILISHSISKNDASIAEAVMATKSSQNVPALCVVFDAPYTVGFFLKWGQCFPEAADRLLTMCIPSSEVSYRTFLLQDSGDIVLEWGAKAKKKDWLMGLLAGFTESGVRGLDVVLSGIERALAVVDWGLSCPDEFKKLMGMTCKEHDTTSLAIKMTSFLQDILFVCGDTPGHFFVIRTLLSDPEVRLFYSTHYPLQLGKWDEGETNRNPLN